MTSTNKNLWQKQLELDELVKNNLLKINRSLYGVGSKTSMKLNNLLVYKFEELKTEYQTQFNETFSSTNALPPPNIICNK